MADAKTKLLNTRDYVVIDTETTGLSPNYNEIIELAALRVRDGEVVDEYQTLVKPDEPIDLFVEELTGITNDMVDDAPGIDEVIEDFVDFLGDDPVLGHNVCFDIKFVESGWGSSLPNILFDTKRISMHTLDCGQGLSAVRKACESIYGNALSFEHHRALADCHITMFCYETMRPLLVEKYGEIPEDGYRKSCGYSKGIDYGDIKPTVDVIDEDNPFYGCNVCFTGKLSSMTRAEGAQHAVNAGAVPQSGVTKKTDYLVLGSFDYVSALRGDKSSKLKKAEKLQLDGAPIQIIDEDYFLECLPDGLIG